MAERIENARILFVDDEQKVLNALRRSFQSMDVAWNMQFLTSPQKVLTQLAEQHFDVLVTDISMPDITGLELLEITNAKHPDTQCIVLTGTADLYMAEKLINSVDVFRFYTKPCEAENLASGIKDAIQVARNRRAAPINTLETKVLDRLATAIIVTNSSGKVHYVNSAATALLARHAALRLTQDNDLKAANTDSSRILQERVTAVAESETGETRGLSLVGDDPDDRLHLIFTPLEDSKGVMVFITEVAAKNLPSAAIIRDLFHLTEAEAKLAERLIIGDTVKDASLTLNITESSARTYLKRLLSKLGLNRQADLIAHILSTTMPK